MSLVHLMISFAVIGLVWYLITTYIPMPPPMKTIVTVFAVIILCIILMRLAGLGDVRV